VANGDWNRGGEMNVSAPGPWWELYKEMHKGDPNAETSPWERMER